MTNKIEFTCHGCEGKGWVDSQHKGAMICPVCGGSGKLGTEPFLIEPYPNYPMVVMYGVNLNPFDFNHKEWKTIGVHTTGDIEWVEFNSGYSVASPEGINRDNYPEFFSIYEKDGLTTALPEWFRNAIVHKKQIKKLEPYKINVVPPPLPKKN